MINQEAATKFHGERVILDTATPLHCVTATPRDDPYGFLYGMIPLATTGEHTESPAAKPEIAKIPTSKPVQPK